jgi:hypothetical protein
MGCSDRISSAALGGNIVKSRGDLLLQKRHSEWIQTRVIAGVAVILAQQWPIGLCAGPIAHHVCSDAEKAAGSAVGSL